MQAISRRLLLGVNVWVALLDEQHVHNQATIALWQHPGLGRGQPASLATIRAAIQRACRDADHQFWPDDLSLIGGDALDFTHITGHWQITDAYLLALAVHHGGTLASFDQRIGLHAVRGATSEHLLVL